MKDLLILVIQGTLMMIAILSPFFIAYFVCYYMIYYFANKKYLKTANKIKSLAKERHDKKQAKKEAWTIKKDKTGRLLLKIGGIEK